MLSICPVPGRLPLLAEARAARNAHHRRDLRAISLVCRRRNSRWRDGIQMRAADSRRRRTAKPCGPRSKMASSTWSPPTTPPARRQMKHREEGRLDLAWGGIASLGLALPVLWTAMARADEHAQSSPNGWPPRPLAWPASQAEKARSPPGPTPTSPSSIPTPNGLLPRRSAFSPQALALPGREAARAR